MTKRALTVDINEQICPDRWSYSFDGKYSVAREEFDDITNGELKELAERWSKTKGSLHTSKVEGKMLVVTRKATQAEAPSILAIEGVRQASVLELVTLQTVFAVIEDILTVVGKEEE